MANPALRQLQAGFRPAAGIKVSLSAIKPVNALFQPTTGVTAQSTTPQRFISALLSPQLGVSIPSLQWRQVIGSAFTISAGLSPLAASIRVIKKLNATFSPSTGITVNFAAIHQTMAAKALLSAESNTRPHLSQVQRQFDAVLMTIQTGLSQPLINIPRFISSSFHPTAGLECDVFPVKFISAAMNVQVGLTADAIWEKFQWEKYGSQLLYQAASGLEKAMIDADAPRLLNMPAEIIIDTWDPYRIPLPLLPYLAWAMGVNFWNDNWSEDTKRAWVADQWLFKRLRGTNAGIEMAIDFAGRDVSPFGYHVRQIITQPQGQYPSPAQSKAEREAWLATLPQVRVYLYQQAGQATPDEFYMKHSIIGP